MHSHLEHWQRATELNDIIIGSSTVFNWAQPGSPVSALPEWQADALFKLVALTLGEDITYLSSAMPVGVEWRIVAFTARTVIRLTMVPGREGSYATFATVLNRASLISLDLISVDPIPDDQTPWPGGVTMMAHYAADTLALPLDEFSSLQNKAEIVTLFSSMLNDVSG